MRRGRHVALYTPKTLGIKPIVGLMRLKDGRWRASGPEKYTYTEPDEAAAIARFRAWEAKKNGQLSIKFELEPLGPGTADEAMPILTSIDPETGQVTQHIAEDAFWARVTRELLTRKQYAAERTGIEKLAYLDDLKPPEALPTFQEMEDVWRKHCRASDEQRRKVLHDWNDFATTAQVQTLKDIEPDVVIVYRDAVYARKVSGKSQQNLFTRIRRLVSFARARAMAVQECSRVLQCLSLLVPSESTVSLDPKPIDVDDWKKLLKTATGDDKVMLLVMLNCAMYLGEVVALKWRDIKGEYILTHRAKTDKVVRLATLWPETKAALAGVRHHGDHVFIAAHGRRLGIKGAELRWRELRKAAGVQEVTSSQLRDGAATAAAEAGIEPTIINLLLGHRSGINDHYVKRAPERVRPACDAVYAKYFPPATTAGEQRPRTRKTKTKPAEI
jgi:integrase